MLPQNQTVRRRPHFGPLPNLHRTRLASHCDWTSHGKHALLCMRNGFVFDGKTYRSLTAIAKRITGAHWSGPRFFGL